MSIMFMALCFFFFSLPCLINMRLFNVHLRIFAPTFICCIYFKLSMIKLACLTPIVIVLNNKKNIVTKYILFIEIKSKA